MSDEQFDQEEVAGTDVAKKLRRLIEVREKRDISKATAERDEKEYRAIEAEVIDALEESPLEPPYKVDFGEPYGVVRFSPRETIYGRVIDKEAALDYFEQRALMDELTEPKIAMARLNEIVRELHEQGEAMPDGVDFVPRRYITITRQKG